MVRMWALVLGMEIVAVAVAVLGFGWLVLLVGAPLIVVTMLIVLVVWMSEGVRLHRQHRVAAADEARANDPERTVVFAPVTQRGLMSGFFELPGRPAARVPAQQRPVEARGPVAR